MVDYGLRHDDALAKKIICWGAPKYEELGYRMAEATGRFHLAVRRFCLAVGSSKKTYVNGDKRDWSLMMSNAGNYHTMSLEYWCAMVYRGVSSRLTD